MLNVKTCPYTPALSINSFYTASEAVREVGFFFNGESHDTWECVFIIEGRAGVSAGETVYTLEEGQVILHPPLEFHRLWNDGDIDLEKTAEIFEYAIKNGVNYFGICITS